MNLFNKVRNFVKESFNNDAQMLHFDRTVHWLKQLNPDADEALLIAGIGHDIERAFKKERGRFDTKNKHFTDNDLLDYHSKKGAQILGDFLVIQGAGYKLIERVKHLVSKHEVGGDDEQNTLKDADNLSFVENNASIFIKKLDKHGYEKVKEKFEWMYNRITSFEAKELATPYYQKMMEDLELAREIND